MAPFAVILTTFLIQLSWGYNEDLYLLPEMSETAYMSPPEMQEDNEPSLHRRNNNNNFLRFGRSGRTSNDFEEEDYSEDFARPTRSGRIEKNDHFIRFGRNRQDFLRFGRDPHRETRAKSSNYLRFGRSAPEEKPRSKRSAFTELKRAGSNFLRFGRNSNFMRFGRNQITTTPDPEYAQHEDTPLVVLLAELLDNIKKEQSKNRIV